MLCGFKKLLIFSVNVNISETRKETCFTFKHSNVVHYDQNTVTEAAHQEMRRNGALLK